MTFGTCSSRYILSGVKTYPEKLVSMLYCLLAALICLQNATFNCLKHGFFNYQNSNMSDLFFLISLEWKIVLKWILCQNDYWFLQNTLTANHNLSPWWHQPHLLMLGHIFPIKFLTQIFPNITYQFKVITMSLPIWVLRKIYPTFIIYHSCWHKFEIFLTQQQYKNIQKYSIILFIFF